MKIITKFDIDEEVIMKNSGGIIGTIIKIIKEYRNVYYTIDYWAESVQQTAVCYDFQLEKTK